MPLLPSEICLKTSQPVVAENFFISKKPKAFGASQKRLVKVGGIRQNSKEERILMEDLYGGHCAKCFIDVISFNLHINPLILVALSLTK